MLLAIPFFVMGSFLSHWIHSLLLLLILALVAINQPFTIWLMYSFFLDILRDLDEAAAIDGCNLWQASDRDLAPGSRGLMAAALFSCYFHTTSFCLPSC